MDRLATRYPRVFPLWKRLFDAGTAAYYADPVSNLSLEGHGIAEQFGVYIARHAVGRLLDIGCGPQPVPVYLARYSLADITGCDPLPPQAPHPFKFEFAVAEDLPWPDASFDTITLATSLDHVINLDDALMEIARVLVPGGRLLLWVGFVAGAAPHDREKEPAGIDAYHMFHFDEGWFEDLLGQQFEIRNRINIADNSWFYRYEKSASELDRLAVKLDFGRRQLRDQIRDLEAKVRPNLAALVSGVTAEHAALIRRLSDTEAERAGIAQQLAAAEQGGKVLREAYEWIVEQLIGITTTLASVQAERQSLSAQLAAERQSLSAQLANTTELLRHVESERDGLLNSTSWRITRPLRSATVRLRGVRRLAAQSLGRTGAALSDGGRLMLRRGGGAALSALIACAGWWRLNFGRPRTMWGVTPILTLPLLARCDRLLGFRSESLVFTVYYTTNSFDINLKWLCELVHRRYPRWSAAFHALVLRLALARYDIFHMFCDRGLLPPTRRFEINPHELQTIRRYGRRLYTYTYGADVRIRAATLALGRYNVCAECPEPGRFCVCDGIEGNGNIARIREYATAMVTMGDMLAYVPGSQNLSYWPIDVARFPEAVTDWRPGRPLRIAHAPNHAHFKGTHYLTSAIDRLRSEGWAIELVRIEGVPNPEVIALFKSCDIVADQFIAGFHGYTAFEAMALGKPVLCYLRDPSAVLDPDNCPIINVWPDTIYDVLKQCLRGEFDLAQFGRRSRSYVAHYHSLEAVAARLGRLYIETGSFPRRINRRLARRITELEKATSPLLPGLPPIAWDCVAETELNRVAPADADGPAPPLATEQADATCLVMDWLRQAKPFHAVSRWLRDTRSREIVMLAVSELRIDPRIEREARALAADGWQVRIIAPDLSRPSFAAEPLDWGPGVSFDLLPPEAAGYAMRVPGLIGDEMYRRAVRFQPFAFHCHDLSTALIGLRAASETGSRWICDFHEWWSENVTWNLAKSVYEPHDAETAAFYRWAERVCLRRADAVITVNRSIASQLEQMVSAERKRVTVIRNVPPLNAPPTRAYPPLKAQFAIPAEHFVVLYQGGTGPTRLLEPVIEALALAARVTLVIRGPSLDMFGADYRRIAEAAGVGERLVLANPVPSCDVVAAARGADAGLWTLPNLSRNFFYALPNKIFEYLASGLPLLVANFPEAKGIVDELGVGLAFDPYDSASIAGQMNRLAEDACFLARCREAVPRALATLDADAEWQRLAALYDGLRGVGATPSASAELVAS